MKFKDIKLRYIVVPSCAFILALWFLPTQAHKSLEPIYYNTESVESAGDEESTPASQPRIEERVQFSTETFSWQKWITWAIATGNGLLGTIVQIQRMKDKKTNQPT